MNKLKPLSWLMVLAVCPVFAADGPVPSRVIPSVATSSTLTPDMLESDTSSKIRTAGRVTTTTPDVRTAQRAVPNVAKAPDVTVSQDTAARSAVTTRSGNELTLQKSGDINSNSAIRRAGLVLRPSVAEYGGRAIIAGTDQQTGSNIDIDIRKVTGRAANKETLTQAKERLEQTAELNKSCQDQYNECMDQFCSVVDANQKRCSCSVNLARYRKVEEAVTAANDKLNEVAQNIRYIGLSADEIRAIMTATEAEEALSGTRDNTENRNMLEQIEDMIKDPKSYTATYTNDGFGLDMDLDFSSTDNLFSLDFLNTNTSSFSNLRGGELYNAAKNRCNAVLTQCKKAGATTQQVTGNYDLAIDKDCVAYENGLKKLNDTLVANVRSAERMLQKARLAVLQNKNQYDARGCIGALETCMLDDMVCGDDYSKCVDPTKIYIDENGEVVLGQNISDIIGFMKNYNTTKIDSAFLENAYKTKITKDQCMSSGNDTSGGDGMCTVKYLLQKIGTKQKVTDEGLCRAVLDKCQAYTYNDGTYKPYNDVVVNYIQRAMVNIKAAQYKIISDYASRCMVDVAACYNQQVTQVNAWSQSASTTSVMNIMRGACYDVALTCGYAVFSHDFINEPYISEGGPDKNQLIDKISMMFYQSLVCPDNSTYRGGAHAVSDNESAGANDNVGDTGYVNSACRCNAGYVVWEGKCLRACDGNATRNLYGTCVCNSGYSGDGFTCTQNNVEGS